MVLRLSIGGFWFCGFVAAAHSKSLQKPRLQPLCNSPARKDSTAARDQSGMNNGSDYDFIIIGSGAGGGTLAYQLAPSGKKILLIERGPFVRREKENWNSLEVNARGRYNTKELWRNADGNELHPHTNYYVGGNTKFYGAALVPSARARISARSSITAAFRPPGRFPTTNSSPTTPRRSASIMCTAGRRRSDRAAAQRRRILIPRSATSRAFSN